MKTLKIVLIGEMFVLLCLPVKSKAIPYVCLTSHLSLLGTVCSYHACVVGSSSFLSMPRPLQICAGFAPCLLFWLFCQMHGILPYSPMHVALPPLGSFFQNAVGGFSAAPVVGLEARPPAWPLFWCVVCREALSCPHHLPP